MTNKFKEEDLIRYLYKDCTTDMQKAIEEALEIDLELSDRMKVLQRTINQLDKLKLQSPSKQTIKTILKYAADRSGR
jgi:hypothetical protein